MSKAPVTRAIHISQLRERRNADAETRIGALERLIAVLAVRLQLGSGAGAAPA